MDLKQRIQAFVGLGNFLLENTKSNTLSVEVEPIAKTAFINNGWFTLENITKSFVEWGKNLQIQSLESWIFTYLDGFKQSKPKNIMVIAAGNLPLVAFHDILSVLITGNNLLLKQASDDKILNKFLLDKLCEIEPGFKPKIKIIDGLQKEFDAVIATGSNNSARYFEQYFGNKPNIIRKNRNSVAVLTGQETNEQLNGLAQDILQYFGLGCRSVSKLYLPVNYDLNKIFAAVFPYKSIIEHNKYANNYDYHRAIFMLNKDSFLENGVIVLKQSNQIASPVSVVFYEYYNTINDVEMQLHLLNEQIQCVVGNNFEVPFGSAQSPNLKQYADGVDTVNFLLQLN